MPKLPAYDFHYRSRQRFFTAFLASATSLLGLGLIFSLTTGFLGSPATKTDSGESLAAYPTRVTSPIRIRPSPALDLKVQNVTRDQSRFYVYVCRIGTGQASAQSYDIYVTNTTTGVSYPRVFSHPFSIPSVGRCAKAGYACRLLGGNCSDSSVIEAIVDPDDVIAESDENNNTRKRYFASPGPSTSR